jgi:AcrR family transcriptional regulator
MPLQARRGLLSMRTPGSNGAETLRTLRAAAMRLLAKHGYEGMNLRTLAKSVGVQAGTLYNYIDSKQDLLFWLLKDASEKILAEFDEHVATIEEPEAQMRAFVDFHLNYHIVNRKESTVLQTEVRGLTLKNYRVVTELQRAYTEKVHAIVKRGIATRRFKVSDSQVTTFAIIQMLTAMIRWYRPDGRLAPEQLIEVYTELVSGMLHTDAPARRAPLANGSVMSSSAG